jgi:hypothetical protein
VIVGLTAHAAKVIIQPRAPDVEAEVDGLLVVKVDVHVHRAWRPAR